MMKANRQLRSATTALFVVLGFGFCAQTSLAKTGCKDLNLQTPSTVNFNANTARQVTLKVSRADTNHGCDYFLTFSRGFSSDYNRKMYKGSDTAPYQLYRSFPYADVLKDHSDAVSNADVVANSFSDKAGSTLNLESYRAVLGAVAYKAVGYYQDVVTVRLYEGTLSSNTLRQSATVSFIYSSTRSIDLSLVSTGAPFDSSATSRSLSFGAMYKGQTMGLDIVLKTNAGYSVSMNSTNGNRMKHLALNSTVSYMLSVNGTPVSLSGAATEVARGSGSSPSNGTRIPLIATIGALAGSVSGDYRDAVTITVQTTE